MVQFVVKGAEAPTEPVIKVWLEHGVPGAVALWGEDGAGRSKVILQLLSNGTVCLTPAAELDGLRTDRAGRVQAA